jgi:hypothetical protein
MVASMKIAELLRVLEQALRQEAPSMETDKASAQPFSLLLAEYRDLTVDEFCRKARDGLQKKNKAKTVAPATKPAKTTPAKTAPAKAGSTVNETAVGLYLGELQQTKGDSSQFETVIARMTKDKEVRLPEAREIARIFMGSSRAYKTKAEAAKAILQRQITDVRAAGKAKHIGDIF